MQTPPKKRYRVYISGGITGKPNGNKEAFDAMEKRLYALGYDVENPRRASWPGYLSLDDAIEAKEGWHLMMRKSLAQQALCDIVVFLPDWEQSKGARVEYQTALVYGQLCLNADLEVLIEGLNAPERVFVLP